jgi:hypothetical protein
MDLQDQIYDRCINYHGPDAATDALVQCMTVHRAFERDLQDTAEQSFDFSRSVLLVIASSMVFFMQGK